MSIAKSAKQLGFAPDVSGTKKDAISEATFDRLFTPGFGGGADRTTSGAKFPDTHYYTFATFGYKKNTTLKSAVDHTISAMTKPDIKVVRTEEGKIAEQLPDHRLKRLLERPNPETDGHNFMKRWALHRILGGNAYWEILRNGNNQPVQLWHAQPNRVAIEIDDNGKIENYIFKHGGTPNNPDHRVRIDPIDIVHFKKPGPLGDLFGMSDVLPALREIISDNEATEFITSMVQNSAMPGIVITTANEKPPKEELDRIQKQWQQNYGGKNRGKPAIIGNASGVLDVSHTFREMEFPELRKITESRICQTLRVPPIVADANVGLEQSSYNNYQEARHSFYREAMLDYYNEFQSMVNHKLAPQFGRNIEIRLDVSEIEDLKTEPHDQRVREEFKAGLITLDEAREALNRPHLDGDKGEVISTPQGRFRDLEGGITDPKEREVEGDVVSGDSEGSQDDSADEEENEALLPELEGVDAEQKKKKK